MKVITLETPQHGYNGSLLPYKEKFLFFFRHEKNISYSPHYISCCWLNNNFQPISQYFRLGLAGYDPRPFYFRNNIYLSYTNDRCLNFARLSIIPLLNYPIITRNIAINTADFPLSAHEKNWLPFEFQNQLFCIYSFNPYHVVKIDLLSKKAESESLTPHQFKWQYGTISGGSVPFDLNPNEKITFFHSWTAAGADFRNFSRTYHLGAYTFSSHPPFSLLRITPHPFKFPGLHNLPIGHIHHTLFPTTVIRQQSKMMLVYGEHDFATQLAQISITDLEKSLKQFSKFSDSPNITTSKSDRKLQNF